MLNLDRSDKIPTIVDTKYLFRIQTFKLWYMKNTNLEIMRWGKSLICLFQTLGTLFLNKFKKLPKILFPSTNVYILKYAFASYKTFFGLICDQFHYSLWHLMAFLSVRANWHFFQSTHRRRTQIYNFSVLCIHLASMNANTP